MTIIAMTTPKHRIACAGEGVLGLVVSGMVAQHINNWGWSKILLSSGVVFTPEFSK